jgi:hypothetical protein
LFTTFIIPQGNVSAIQFLFSRVRYPGWANQLRGGNMRYLNILALAISFAMATTVSAAFADGWQVDRVTLPAVYTTDGKTWTPVRQGMNVPNASWINTGDHGRVALSRGTDTMFIGAYSLVATVERGTDAKPVSDVRQPFGAVTIDLKKRGYDQMKVTTPYMAAIVKGTQFTVTARRQRSTLGVNRGLVEVTDRLSGAVAAVGKGGKAEVDAVKSSFSLNGTNTSMTATATARSKAKGNAYGLSKSKTSSVGKSNGKGASNGNSNGNSGGNGNGNSGGNGNGNSGGNGNGNGNGNKD